MQRRKVSGPFHAETSYSPPKVTDRPGYVRLVHRVRLDQITFSQVKGIVDPVIKNLVLGRLKEVAGDDFNETKIKNLLKDGALNDLRMPSGVPIKRARIEEFFKEKTTRTSRDPHTHQIYRSVLNDGNHSISITKAGAQPIETVISSIRDVIEGNEPKNHTLKLHKGDSVEIIGFGVSFVRNLSSTPSNGPYIEIDLNRVSKRETIDKDFKRYTSAKKLLAEVAPVTVSVLGKK
jgi:hypothetical protein